MDEAILKDRSSYHMRFVLLLLACVALGACAAPAGSPTALAASKENTSPSAPDVLACATTNAAPPNEFRSDDPSKLTASNKPKLVEFFAYW